MVSSISESTVRPYTGEKARLCRAYDYLIVVLALFLSSGPFTFTLL